MRIPTRDVPQADNLDLVIRAAEAVARGERSYQGIAAAIGKYADRQGRYYRLAAELLGLIKNEQGKNYSHLTDLGARFLTASSPARRETITNAVLNMRMFQRVIPFLESHGNEGASREQLRAFINEVTEPSGPSVTRRRLNSISRWLEYIGMLSKTDGRYVLGQLPENLEILHYQSDDEPLLPQTYALTEYQENEQRSRREIRNIQIMVDQAKHERAKASHRSLTRLVAARIRAAGAIPRDSRLIDLAGSVKERSYLFEMKSTTPETYQSQIRKAVSQLYEYRYIQRMGEATLVIVAEHEPPANLNWLPQYLVEDRKILLAWDGDGQNLYYPDGLDQDLGFLK